ncbi:MAG: VTT domain-containing protein [Candidatus Methanoperedens sp.]
MDISLNFPFYLLLISFASPLGAPLGATFFIISAGSQSGTISDYFFFVTIIFFGLVIGDIAAYTAGSYFETFFTDKLCKHDKIIGKCKSGKDLYNKYGASSVFFSRFLFLGFGAPVNYISGFSKYSFRNFLIMAASGEFLYAIIYTYIGFIFRDSWTFLLDTIVDFSLTILLFLAALFASYQLKRYL